MAVTISGSTGIDKVVDGSIAAVDLAANAVTTAKIADDAITLAKMAPGTDGNLITYDASQNPAYVATGTAGQLLTSAGTGAPPTFTTVSSGGLTQLFTVDMDASPASTYNTGTLDLSTYKYLWFSGENIHLTVDTGGGLGLTPNGSTLINFTAGCGPTLGIWFNSFFDLTRHYGAGSHIATTKDSTTIGSTGSTSSFVHNGLTTSTTSIQFSNPAGTNFIGGDLTLYGLK